LADLVVATLNAQRECDRTWPIGFLRGPDGEPDRLNVVGRNNPQFKPDIEG
jgi:hypothetical protein